MELVHQSTILMFSLQDKQYILIDPVACNSSYTPSNPRPSTLPLPRVSLVPFLFSFPTIYYKQSFTNIIFT